MINQNMIKKINKMKQDMMKAQEEINNSTFYASAGGGLVSVEAKGTKEIVSIKIEEIDDKEMLEEALVAAINSVIEKIDKETEEVMSQFTQGMPGLF